MSTVEDLLTVNVPPSKAEKPVGKVRESFPPPPEKPAKRKYTRKEKPTKEEVMEENKISGEAIAHHAKVLKEADPESKEAKKSREKIAKYLKELNKYNKKAIKNFQRKDVKDPNKPSNRINIAAMNMEDLGKLLSDLNVKYEEAQEMPDSTEKEKTKKYNEMRKSLFRILKVKSEIADKLIADGQERNTKITEQIPSSAVRIPEIKYITFI